jgi:hypothetical protein
VRDVSDEPLEGVGPELLPPHVFVQRDGGLPVVHVHLLDPLADRDGALPDGVWRAKGFRHDNGWVNGVS